MKKSDFPHRLASSPLTASLHQPAFQPSAYLEPCTVGRPMVDLTYPKVTGAHGGRTTYKLTGGSFPRGLTVSERGEQTKSSWGNFNFRSGKNQNKHTLLETRGPPMWTNSVPPVRVIIRVLDKHCKRPRCDFKQIKQHFMKKKEEKTMAEKKNKKRFRYGTAEPSITVPSSNYAANHRGLFPCSLWSCCFS